MEQKKKILLFRVKNEKAEQIKNLGRLLDLEISRIDRMQYGEPLGRLAGIPGSYSRFAEGKIYSGPELPAEMMVFSGLESEDLDVFLKKYREAGIEPIGIKAVVTPFNMFWSSHQLFEELMKEHMAMRQQ